MTEPKQTGMKDGFLFGIRTEEKDKTYTLNVNASSAEEAMNKLSFAINTIKNNKLDVNANIAGDFTFCIQNEPNQNGPEGNIIGYLAITRLDVSHEIRQQATELIDQQLRGQIDSVTARAGWYRLTEENGGEALADYLTWALHDALKRSYRKHVSYGTGISGIPISGPEHEQRAENYAEICRVISGQINDNRDLNRASKFWHDYLNRPDCDRAMLVDALMHVLSCTYADLKQG